MSEEIKEEKISPGDVIGILVMTIISMLFASATTFAISLPIIYAYYILTDMLKTTFYNLVLLLTFIIPFSISFVWFIDRLSEKELDRKISGKLTLLTRKGERDEQ